MNLKNAIRRKVWPDANMTELARDVAQALASLLGLELKTLKGPYTEPMYLSVDDQPRALVCLRVRGTATPEAVVSFGCATNFVYEPDARRCRITDVQSLAVGATEYLFDFLVVY